VLGTYKTRKKYEGIMASGCFFSAKWLMERCDADILAMLPCHMLCMTIKDLD